MKSELQEARSLLFNQNFGVLSTISEEFDRYPFGSLTPYSLNHLGEPVIPIAEIAQHTINIKADSRVSLTILEDGVENIQARARLTVMADAEKQMMKTRRNDTFSAFHTRDITIKNTALVFTG